MIQKRWYQALEELGEEISQGSQKEMKRSNAKFKKAIALCSLCLRFDRPLAPCCPFSPSRVQRDKLSNFLDIGMFTVMPGAEMVLVMMLF